MPVTRGRAGSRGRGRGRTTSAATHAPPTSQAEPTAHQRSILSSSFTATGYGSRNAYLRDAVYGSLSRAETLADRLRLGDVETRRNWSFCDADTSKGTRTTSSASAFDDPTAGLGRCGLFGIGRPLSSVRFDDLTLHLHLEFESLLTASK